LNADPDPDPATQINADPDTDLDPKPWLLPTANRTYTTFMWTDAESEEKTVLETVLWIRIPTDPRHFGKLDPGPDQSER
jgi:hypothetical protein